MAMEEDRLGTGSSRALEVRCSDMIWSSCLAASNINLYPPHIFLNQRKVNIYQIVEGARLRR